MPRIERLVALCREAGRPRPSGITRAVDPAGPDSRPSRRSRSRPPAGVSLPSKTFSRRIHRGPTLLLALDGVEDPQNLGALLRVADEPEWTAFCSLSAAQPLSARSPSKPAPALPSTCASLRVVNLVRALEELKKQNIWVIVSTNAAHPITTSSTSPATASSSSAAEGAGLHDLVRRTCDHLLRIPMAGGVSSLNVSAAGAVVLFEAFRQRRNGSPASRRRSPQPHYCVETKETERSGLVKFFLPHTMSGAPSLPRFCFCGFGVPSARFFALWGDQGWETTNLIQYCFCFINCFSPRKPSCMGAIHPPQPAPQPEQPHQGKIIFSAPDSEAAPIPPQAPTKPMRADSEQLAAPQVPDSAHASG